MFHNTQVNKNFHGKGIDKIIQGLVITEVKNEVEWAGCVGYQNMVRLDRSLTNSNIRVIKLNDDKYRFEKSV